MQPSKLLSLLLVQSTIFISLPTFRDQSVLSDNDPPCTILIRILVSNYKREVFAIEPRGYLLQVLPVRVSDCNTQKFFFRNPIDCAKYLLGQRCFAQDLVYTPVKEWNSE